MDYLAEAYLDDYNLITIKINRMFHNGVSEVFYLQKGKDIYKLKVASSNISDNEVEYKLTFDFDIEIPSKYDVLLRDGYRICLKYRYIVKSERFNKEYYYDQNDLGSIVYNNTTSFKVWAPSANSMYLKLDECFYKMTYNHGVYEYVVDEDLSGKAYQYLVEVNGEVYLTNDPYAKACLANNKGSVVVPNSNNKVSYSEGIDYRDAIIYEASVRDFSKEGIFNSFDVDYLKALGITHLQLLPVVDFSTVDEYHKDVFYNWGYDPINYECLEGSYSSDVNDPLKVIVEFKDLVNRLHNKGIKLNLDIVFNHHYNALTSSLNRVVPYYYFRYKDDKLCDGTYCGNEISSEMPMARKYIIDTLKYFVNNFDVDGFRFDLMSFIDIETMNMVKEELSNIKPSIMIYGEGWDMQSGIDRNNMSIRPFKDRLKGIAFFNDEYRDGMLGKVFDRYETGYINGYKYLDHILNLQTDNCDQYINYVQCHDNLTAFDKCLATNNDAKTSNKQVMLASVTTLLSFGIPFINAGQEFAIAKNGIDNCYNVVDEINKLIYHNKNEKMFKLFVDTIDFRKNSKFYLENIIDKYLDNNVMIIKTDKYTFVYNPNKDDYIYHINNENKLVLNTNGYINENINNDITVEAISFVVLEK